MVIVGHQKRAWGWGTGHTKMRNLSVQLGTPHLGPASALSQSLPKLNARRHGWPLLFCSWRTKYPKFLPTRVPTVWGGCLQTPWSAGCLVCHPSAHQRGLRTPCPRGAPGRRTPPAGSPGHPPAGCPARQTPAPLPPLPTPAPISHRPVTTQSPIGRESDRASGTAAVACPCAHLLTWAATQGKRAICMAGATKNMRCNMHQKYAQNAC